MCLSYANYSHPGNHWYKNDQFHVDSQYCSSVYFYFLINSNDSVPWVGEMVVDKGLKSHSNYPRRPPFPLMMKPENRGGNSLRRCHRRRTLPTLIKSADRSRPSCPIPWQLQRSKTRPQFSLCSLRPPPTLNVLSERVGTYANSFLPVPVCITRVVFPRRIRWVAWIPRTNY